MATKDTYITSSHDVTIDSNYANWLHALKDNYQKAQVKAAIKVNAEKLLWNWQLGRDLVLRKAEEQWGTGVVEQLSLDLQAAFPNEKGFSSRNLRSMRQWYEFYSTIWNQPGSKLLSVENQPSIKLHQVGAEIHEKVDEGMPFPEIFAYVPWRHHVEILKSCKTVEEALYYIHQVIDEGWSRQTLMNCLKADRYHNHGNAVSNFTEQLPEQQAQLAQEITKDNYDFGFITLPKEYKENELEDALAQNISRFLLELGTGFAFVGRQVELVVAGKSRRIDLLFYHIQLRAYVCLELKAVPFEPEFVGKLNFYVNAIDKFKKTENDNPTIGLLICSNMNETEVQWSFEGLTTPIGVASYSNVNEEDLKRLLPTKEALVERIKLLEAEISKSKK